MATVDDVEKRAKDLQKYLYSNTPYDLTKLEKTNERLFDNLQKICRGIQHDGLRLLEDEHLPHADVLRVEGALTIVSSVWQRLGMKR